MARFMARNITWPENIFYGQGGSNKARLEKSGHQMARLATLKARQISTPNQYVPQNYETYLVQCGNILFGVCVTSGKPVLLQRAGG